MTDSDNHEYIIFIEIINVVNDIILFFFIFKRSFIVHRLTVNDFHWIITLIINEIAYLNDKLIINWLQHFIKNVKKKWIDKWILSIYDKFEFHVIYHFLQLIINNKIILFRFLFYSTHFRQSLNVKIFLNIQTLSWQYYKQSRKTEKYQV